MNVLLLSGTGFHLLKGMARMAAVETPREMWVQLTTPEFSGAIARFEVGFSPSSAEDRIQDMVNQRQVLYYWALGLDSSTAVKN